MFRTGKWNAAHVGRILLTIAMLCIGFLLFRGCGSNHYEYEIWKDSHDAFGNAEYQVLHGTDRNGNAYLSLHNMDVNAAILQDVRSYHTVGDLVYFLGAYASNHQRFDVVVILDVTDNSLEIVVDEKDAASGLLEELKHDAAYFFPNKPITIHTGDLKSIAQAYDLMTESASDTQEG